MKIERIDLFYFALPEIKDQSDGSQDSFIVRVRTDTGLEGYGESDSSPLLALAAYTMPMSHSNLVNLSEVLIGRRIDTPDDIRAAYAFAKRRALDMAHFPHAYAAADIALWDVLGKHLNKPVYRLLGHGQNLAKRAYASVLFQDTPVATGELAAQARRLGFRAAKFGWGPLGQRGAKFDIDLVRQARAGLGNDAALMVDAGTVWQDDDATALQRAQAFAAFNLTWLEEPLSTEAVAAYGRLSRKSPVPIAAGEGCNTYRAAEDLLENGGLAYLQIDPGRIGGITPSFDAYQLARRRGAIFVNHTFKSQISLAAAMAVFAGDETMPWVEFCQSGSPLITGLVRTPIQIDPSGQVRLHEKPGLGMEVSLEAVRPFAHHASISLDGRIIGESSRDDR
jgi:L-alanine-DL-glutamate epimerase-like enolase superfamily enzyme